MQPCPKYGTQDMPSFQNHKRKLAQAHKTWADAKIVQLIKRVKEETVRSEALNLKDEVQQLRLVCLLT